MPEYDMQEGYGDSDEVLGSTIGLSGEFNSVSFNNNNRGSGGNNEKGKETNGGDKTSRGGRTTRSLGVRRRGDAIKKNGLTSVKIADGLSSIADAVDIDAERSRADRIATEARVNRIAAEAYAERMAAEARAYEISIAGVMSHLNQVLEVVFDNEFYAQCVHLLMNHLFVRELYAVMKDMRDKLMVFLRHECYRQMNCIRNDVTI